VDSLTVAEKAQDWRQALALYYPRVRGWYARVLTDQAAAEDLAQEVFVRLCQQLAKGEVMANPWNYIKAVARNVFLEHLRAKKRQKKFHALDELGAVTALSGPAETCSQELLEAVPPLLAHLSAAQRFLLVGRFYLGMTVRELAKTTGTSASTVVEHQNRALCRLQELASNRGIEL
jgi:RNA polymerase sigma factor (sigma-70 family)